MEFITSTLFHWLHFSEFTAEFVRDASCGISDRQLKRVSDWIILAVRRVLAARPFLEY
jgi:hypothetical protein